ncbi:MAG TPA: right-handed parallel beta-helix repeat-containing protein [Fimbriimonadaceae bacterium]|nr:right-handed parallel beta-helix repeat-containing protein [Fimbriimonadaceae bacterium]
MLLPFLALALIPQPVVQVGDLGSLRAALSQAKPGTKISVAAGDYDGGLYATGLSGTAAAPIVIAGADPKNPPKFHGAIQFQAGSYLEFDDLAIVGVTGNAIGIDDGGVREKPSSHIALRGLRITQSLGAGSSGIKMAGVDDFRIEDCAVDGFAGCGIDMVGCHHGTIENCRFEQGGGVAVQAKGASFDVAIRKCRFVDYGASGVNIGQSTGIPFFRPSLDKLPAGSRFEAKSITVEGCTFKGGAVPFAFAGADGGFVRFNTIYEPSKWAIRILQETATPDFVPCRNGRFEDNIVVFRSDRWFEGGVNVGPKTAPETFRFARNWWYCNDKPDRSRPTLPTAEEGGSYGQDPMVRASDLDLDLASPAKMAGAGALPKS